MLPSAEHRLLRRQEGETSHRHAPGPDSLKRADQGPQLPALPSESIELTESERTRRSSARQAEENKQRQQEDPDAWIEAQLKLLPASPHVPAEQAASERDVEARNKAIQSLIEQAHTLKGTKEEVAARRQEIKQNLIRIGPPAVASLVANIQTAAAAGAIEPNETVLSALVAIVTVDESGRRALVHALMTSDEKGAQALYLVFYRAGSILLPALLGVVDRSEWDTIYPPLSFASLQKLDVLMPEADKKDRSMFALRLRRAQYKLEQLQDEKRLALVVSAINQDDLALIDEVDSDLLPKADRTQEDLIASLLKRHKGTFTSEQCLALLLDLPDPAQISRALDVLDRMTGDLEIAAAEQAGKGMYYLGSGRDDRGAKVVIDFLQAPGRTPEDVRIVTPFLMTTDDGLVALRKAMDPARPVASRLAIINGIHAYPGTLLDFQFRVLVPMLLAALKQPEYGPVRSQILDIIAEGEVEYADETLTELLNAKDTPPDLRLKTMATLDALSRFSSRNVSTFSTRVATTTVPVPERLAAAKYLANRGRGLLKQTTDAPLRDALQVLIGVLSDKDETPAMRQGVAVALAHMVSEILNSDTSNTSIPKEEISRRQNYVRQDILGKLLALDVDWSKRSNKPLLEKMEKLPIDAIIANIKQGDPTVAAGAVGLATSMMLRDTGDKSFIGLSRALFERYELARREKGEPNRLLCERLEKAKTIFRTMLAERRQ